LLFAFSFCLRGPLDHAEDVVLAHDQILIVIEFDFGAAYLNNTRSPSLTSIARRSPLSGFLPSRRR
jgi:hypothetical protein